MLEPYAEDAVWDISAVFTDTSPVRGHREMVRQWKELQDTWGGGIRLDPLELRELDDGRLVLDVRLWGKGTRSGVEVDQRFALLYDVGPDGRIVRARLFPDVAAARSAAKEPASQQHVLSS